MKQPHLLLDEVSPWVLTCGDPARAKAIGGRLEQAREISFNREYLTVRGFYRGIDVTVTSHGVGASGAGICFEELIKAGAKLIIRVGTCGALVDGINQGDILVATGAVREEGTSKGLVPPEYPAVATPEVVLALDEAVRKLGHPCRRGLIVSEDTFYPGPMPKRLELYSRAGVIGVEMEFSALFVIASIRNIMAGGIACVDGNPLKWDRGNYDPHGERVKNGKEAMITAALESLVILKEKYNL